MLALIYLILAVLGLLCSLAALRPPDRPRAISTAAFIPSLVLGEWSPQALVIHVVIVGALAAWAVGHTLSRIGLGIAGLTTVALIWLTVRQIVALRHRPGLDGPGVARRQRLTGVPLRPSDVQVTRNVPFATRGALQLRADIYRRRDHPTGCPVLIQVHGGAWVMGGKEEQGLPLMHLLARRGWVCVSLAYRLSPKATFPDHIVDVKEGIAWVRAHIAEHGGDPSRIVITGGSAGGHLSSLAALTPGLEQPGFEDADTTVLGCVSMYGVYDFLDIEGYWKGRGLDRLLERRVMKASPTEARSLYEAASPLNHVSESAPAFLVVQGTADTLVPPREATVFAAKLREVSRKPVILLEVPHAQHAFDSLPSMRTVATLDHVVAFCEGLASAIPKPQEVGRAGWAGAEGSASDEAQPSETKAQWTSSEAINTAQPARRNVER